MQAQIIRAQVALAMSHRSSIRERAGTPSASSIGHAHHRRCHACAQLAALSITALLATLPHVTAAKCGSLVFAQGFNHYKGDYKPWSAELAATDFDVGDTARPSAAGKVLKPGIEPASRGFKNVKVGKGHMRLDYTKGTQPVG